MSVSNKISFINNEFKRIVEENSLSVYEKVTGIEFSSIEKEVVKGILELEKKLEAEGRKLDPATKGEAYIKEETTRKFYKRVNAFMDKEGLGIDVEEEIVDGKDIVRYRVTKVIKTMDLTLDFEYDFKVNSGLLLEKADTKVASDLEKELNKEETKVNTKKKAKSKKKTK